MLTAIVALLGDKVNAVTLFIKESNDYTFRQKVTNGLDIGSLDDVFAVSNRSTKYAPRHREKSAWF